MNETGLENRRSPFFLFEFTKLYKECRILFGRPGNHWAPKQDAIAIIESLLPRVRVFKFSEEIVQEKIPPSRLFSRYGLPEVVLIDLPFPVCWFEGADGTALYNGHTKDRDTGITETVFDYGCLAAEVDDGYFVAFLSLVETQGQTLPTIHCYLLERTGEQKTIGSSVLCYAAQVLSDVIGGKESVIAEEETAIREKVKNSDGTKSVIKIREIVHVSTKQGLAAYSERQGIPREVEWSHRWEVMGHWRRVDGVGKNRLGEYCVQGKTWVIPHSKGAEDRKTISKFRVVGAVTKERRS